MASNIYLEKLKSILGKEDGYRQLLFDVSGISRYDDKTGIHRVVRAQLLALKKLAPHNLKVEPVYLCTTNNLHYRYAKKYADTLFGNNDNMDDKPVSVENGDIFYSADFYKDGIIKAAQSGLYSEWSSQGVSINFLIHDILPIQYPELFPVNADTVFIKWFEVLMPSVDTFICTTQTGKSNLLEWMSSYFSSRDLSKVKTQVLRLGSNIMAASRTVKSSENTEHKYIFDIIKSRPTFLMVGTIEPRKGYLFALEAFERLWKNNANMNLVIVGKEGWIGISNRRSIPKIVEKLRHHPQLGKHLFWLEGISDAMLEELYHSSSALIAASEDEGFGLPLIEAAKHGLPVIARDIPVFREVTAGNAYFFPDSKEPYKLSDAIESWLDQYEKGSYMVSDTMHCPTWEESTYELLNILIRKNNNMKKNTSEIIIEKIKKEAAERNALKSKTKNSSNNDSSVSITQLTGMKEMSKLFKSQKKYILNRLKQEYQY